MSETTADRIALLRKAKTLPDLIANRAKTAPDDEALRQYDRSKGEWVSTTFGELQERILEWHKAYAALKLERGSRVGILLPNGIDAVCADQGALANALVPVPMHAIDTAGASAFILIDSQASVLVTKQAVPLAGDRRHRHHPSGSAARHSYRGNLGSRTGRRN